LASFFCSDDPGFVFTCECPRMKAVPDSHSFHSSCSCSNKRSSTLGLAGASNVNLICFFLSAGAAEESSIHSVVTADGAPSWASL
jgi:hypothetical protein